MSGGVRLENVNPKIYEQVEARPVTLEEEDEEIVDKIDDREVFDIL